MKIVVLCPAGAVTGGPEALHQLVHIANMVEHGSAAICYLPNESPSNIPQPYLKYKTPTIRYSDIPISAVVVVPELWPYMVDNLENPCALWWLSVDNFVCQDASIVHKYAYHITQSQYAFEYLQNTYGILPMMVTDYTSDDYVPVINNERKRRVAVNPAKGAELIEEFISLNPDVEVFRVQGLQSSQIQTELSNSIMYIDFGHHPGKDRLPREAAKAGCIVSVRNIGAAVNNIDVPIDALYKFSTVARVREIIDLVFGDPAVHLHAQHEYREKVAAEKNTFLAEVSNFLAAL